MARFTEGTKTLDQSSMSSSVSYGSHTGLSSYRSFSIEDEAVFSVDDEITLSSGSSLAVEYPVGVTERSDDGKYFLYSFEDSVHHFKNGEIVDLGTVVEDAHRFAFSPDSSLLVVLKVNDIYLYDVTPTGISLNKTVNVPGGNFHIADPDMCLSNDGVMCYSRSGTITTYDIIAEDGEKTASSSYTNVQKMGSKGDASDGFVMLIRPISSGHEAYSITENPTDLTVTPLFTLIEELAVEDVIHRDGNFLMSLFSEPGDYRLFLNDTQVEFQNNIIRGICFSEDGTEYIYTNETYEIEGLHQDDSSLRSIVYYDNKFLVIEDQNGVEVYLLSGSGYQDIVVNSEEGIVESPTTSGKLPMMQDSLDFFKYIINVNSSNPTFLRFSLKFEQGDNRMSRKYVENGTIASKKLFEEYIVYNNQKFRVRTSNGNVLYSTSDYSGLINLEVPAGTSSIILETYDDNEHRYARYNQPNLKISNLRVYDYTEPSVGIGNSTNQDSSYDYMSASKLVYLDVEDQEYEGFYDIILGDTSNKDFVVGDTFDEINYRPINQNRNACLEFGYIDWSTVDNDYPIELLIDVTSIDTSYAQDQYDNLGIRSNEVDEFYKNGGKVGVKPLISTGDFPETVSEVSSGSNGTYATPYSVNTFTCGLQKYDITEAVRDSILANKSRLIVWLYYDKLYDRDKYITFSIGNEEYNKPRIRYKKKNV